MGIGIGLGMALGRGGVAPFTPLSLAPLVWFDASDASTLFTDSALTTPATADGDAVGGWKDKSGNGYHATQASGPNKAQLKTAIQNGRNVVRFNGTSSVLDTASFGYAPLTRWAFFVYKTTVAAARSVWSHSASDATDLFAFGNSSTAFYNDIGTGVGPYTNPSSAFSSGYYLLGCVWDRTAGNSVLTFYKNGATTTPTITLATTTPNTTAQVLHLGKGFSFGSQFHDSDICELVYGSGTLTGTQSTNLNTYLNAKWGVY